MTPAPSPRVEPWPLAVRALVWLAGLLFCLDCWAVGYRLALWALQP